MLVKQSDLNFVLNIIFVCLVRVLIQLLVVIFRVIGVYQHRFVVVDVVDVVVDVVDVVVDVDDVVVVDDDVVVVVVVVVTDS